MRARTAAWLIVIGLLGAGCVPEGLAFRVDERVTITTPGDRETVRLPVTVSWTVRDFAVAEPGTPPRPAAGYFAVFVDRTPMAPGQTLQSITRRDAGCADTAACPEGSAALGVYATTATEVVVREVEPQEAGRRDRHRATIVLVDGSGRRIGESAFEVEFDVEREERA